MGQWASHSDADGAPPGPRQMSTLLYWRLLPATSEEKVGGRGWGLPPGTGGTKRSTGPLDKVRGLSPYVPSRTLRPTLHPRPLGWVLNLKCYRAGDDGSPSPFVLNFVTSLPNSVGETRSCKTL